MSYEYKVEQYSLENHYVYSWEQPVREMNTNSMNGWEAWHALTLQSTQIGHATLIVYYRKEIK